jgi:hypothetical protein
MQVTVPSDDPAKDLWSRVDPTDLSKIWHLFDNVPVPVGRVAEALHLALLGG